MFCGVINGKKIFLKFKKSTQSLSEPIKALSNKFTADAQSQNKTLLFQPLFSFNK